VARAVLPASVTALGQLSVTSLREWIQALQLTGREAEIARDLMPEIQAASNSWKRWAWAT
jgi:excinuclease ABC subunit A